MIWILACEDAAPPAAPPAAVYVEAQKVDEGTPVRVHAPAGSTVEANNGLVATAANDETWELRGEPGSYIVTVTPPGAEAVRVFVDIGVEGPDAGELADLVSLPPEPDPTWPIWVGGAAALTTVAALGYAAWQRYKPAPPPPIPDPPHVVALREWDRLRARTDLAPEELARQMSEIFRTWVGAAYGFPATRRTTREIVDNLAGMLTAAELDATRRLLMATDLVKFAERQEHADLFARLDDDFRGLVRPVRRSDRA